MSRELWAVERCPHKYEWGPHPTLPVDGRLVEPCPGLTQWKLDFDAIWDRYYVAAGRNRLPGLTYDELKQVVLGE